VSVARRYPGSVDEVTKLAVAAAAGDRIALRGFVCATQTDVWRLCAHLADAAGADDLTQETYLRALKALPSFRGESSARTWLLVIARRTVADAIRSNVRRRRLDTMPRGGHVEAGSTDAVVLRCAIDALDQDRKAAFVLTQLLGLSYVEAAEVCGVPVGTIRSRIARARSDLVVALDRDASSGSG
jgi:RNA polymerase sigma-70 factor (ECF subfamily)